MPVCFIDSYAKAASLLETARSKRDGKPLGHKLWLRKEEATGDYVCHGASSIEEIFRISPANVLTLTVSPDYVRRHKYAIAGRMGGLVRVRLHNMGKDIHRAVARPAHSSWGEYHDRVLTAPQYFPGIQFQLPDYECLNPKPDMGYMVDKDKRKEWLADMRHMRTTLCAMAKIGALSHITREWSRIAQIPTSDIVEAMKSREYTPAFIDNFVGLALQHVGWWRGAPDNSLIAQRIRAQIAAMSVELRVAYGVLYGEAPKPRVVL